MRRFDRLRQVERRVRGLTADHERLRATLSRLETEWDDTKNQLRRSYQRLEKAGERAEKREKGQPPQDVPDALEGLSDPFSQKLRKVREQSAVHHGNDASAG